MSRSEPLRIQWAGGIMSKDTVSRTSWCNVPRFYFDLHDGPNCSTDEFGDDFDSFEDARQHAQAILGNLLEEELPDGEERTFMCELRDGNHDVLYRCRIKLHGERVTKMEPLA